MGGKGSGNVFGERLLDRPDPSLLVHGGTSGIGTTAILLAREFGVDVHATAGSQHKVLHCQSSKYIGICTGPIMSIKGGVLDRSETQER